MVVSGVWICSAAEQKLRQLRLAELGGVVERRLAGGILNVGIYASPQPLLHILHVTCRSNVEGGVPQDGLLAAIRMALHVEGGRRYRVLRAAVVETRHTALRRFGIKNFVDTRRRELAAYDVQI